MSVVVGSTGGLARMLGAFSFILQEAGFPSISSFQPRFSLAGKLTGNGLPVAIGEPWALLPLVLLLRSSPGAAEGRC